MKELILIFFFSKTILLTPVPVTIIDELSLVPDKSLTAITPGAGLHINISSFSGGISIKESGFVRSEEVLGKLIPPGSVQGILLDESGREVTLDKQVFALEDDKAWLILTSSQGLDSELKFSKVIVRSNIRIRDITIFWKNFSL